MVRSPSARVLTAGVIGAAIMAILAPPATAAVLPGLEVARGHIHAMASYPDGIATSFQSGVPLTVYVTYRPHTTVARTIRTAARVIGGGRSCPPRPTTRDQERAGDEYPAPGNPTVLQVVLHKVRFPAGSSRICTWFDERHGFGRPVHYDLSFVPSLYGAASIAGSDEGAVAWTYLVRSTSGPVKMTSDYLRQDGQGCGPDVTEQVDDHGPPPYEGYTFSVSDPAYPCIGGHAVSEVLSGPDAGRTGDVAAPTSIMALAVTSHVGACVPDIVKHTPPVPAAAVRDVLHAVGCRLGRAYNVLNKGYKLSPTGQIWSTLYRGDGITLAPEGTVVDLYFDAPPGAPAPGVGPPDGAGSAPAPAAPAPDPAPEPGGGYPQMPAASEASGCAAQVKTGPIVAIAGCFRTAGEESVSRGRVRLNGIDLTPATADGVIRINRRTFRVRSTGPVEVRIGTLSLMRGGLDWQRPDQVFEIDGAGRKRGARPRFTVKGQRVYGLPIGGSVSARLEDGRTKLTVGVSVPDEPALRQLKQFAGASGELSVAATNEAGLVLDGATVTMPGFRIGFAEVQAAEVAISQPAPGVFHFDGQATVFPFRFSRTGLSGELGFGPADGYFKVGLAAENLNRPLADGFFLQRIGVGFQVDPFGLSGAAAVTFGPQFRIGGQLVSAARLDGTVAYLSASGDGEPASLELGGALEIAEANAADGKVGLQGDTVSAEGTLALKIAGYGFEGATKGWMRGTSAFDIEGNVGVSLPGPDAGGEAVLSSVGGAACEHGFGPDIGFGYRWGTGVGGMTIIGGGCNLGPWRAARAGSRTAQAGATALTVRKGMAQLAVQVQGAGGPPRIVLAGPGGRQITASTGPDNSFVDATSYYAEDPVTSAAYVVVDRPAPGTWTVVPAGGAPVAAVRTAAPLAAVGVRASVRGHGAGRRLAYRVTHLDASARVTFVEALGSQRRVLGTVRRRRGTLGFTPLSGTGRRTILALVTRGGLPSGTARRVARFRATVRPATPRRLRIARTASARRISWRGSAGLRYEVDVRLSDGRRLRLLARAGKRSVTVTTVARRTRVSATVHARDGHGVASAPARRRG